MKLLSQWAVTSASLILIVLAVRYLFRRKLSARLRYALWAVVLVRLLVPFQVTLPTSVSDFLPLLASNLAPEVADVELYALRTSSRPMPEENLQELRDLGMKPGDVLFYETTHLTTIADHDLESNTHCYVLSDTGIDRYFFYTTLPKFLIALWATGAAAAAWTIFRSNRYFLGRLKYYCHALEDVDASIPVYTAANVSSPCLFGVFRPAVYVTPGAAENPDTLRHILAHELTHYKHKDHIWSLLRCLALALHWYNPLVWLAVVLSKRDGELACDEGAIARLGEAERIPYGRTLVDMVAARSVRPVDLLSCSTAMTGGTKSIQQRVAQLVKKPETVKTALFAAVAVVALSVVFVFAERKEVGEYDAFLAQVRGARSVSVSNPLISSQLSPPPISDPEKLAQAKDILSKPIPVVKVDDTWKVMGLSSDSSQHPKPITQEELEKQFIISGRRLNLYPTVEHDLDSADSYYLSQWDSYCLLAQWYPEREKNTLEVVAAFPSNTITHLEELAWQHGGRYAADAEEYPEALEALIQLFINDEDFLSQNAQAHNTTPEDIAAWLKGEGSEPITPDILIVNRDAWTLSAFGDGSLLFMDLTIPSHLTAQIQDICQSSSIEISW